MSSIQNPLLNITPDIVNNIRKIYNLDDPKRLNEAIKILEHWIQKQPHIVKKDFDKRFLETALITCKGSVEKAKKQIDTLCTMKTMVPKFFVPYNLKTELPTALEKVWHIPLPKLTEDYCRIVWIKSFSNDFTPDDLLQFFQYSIILSEYIRAHDYVNGFVIIVDYRDWNMFKLITRMTTPDVQPFINVLIKGYGGRLKSLHIITESKAVELLVATVRQMISEKLGNRIQVHKTIEDLHEVVNKDLLPEEFGGKQKSCEKIHAELVDELSSEKHIEYLKVMSKACTDETKRNTGKFNEEYMGMPGSFRNLTVD
uniref:SFRICE_027626 n=1 Tax=Spodoptera frugiperda TaxID=7108 RepID=A0A2H1WD56_SPOFR